MDSAQRMEFTTLQAKIVHREIDAMGGKPGGFATQYGQLCGRMIIAVVLQAGFSGLALIGFVKVQNQFVHRILKLNQLQMRLEG